MEILQNLVLHCDAFPSHNPNKVFSYFYMLFIYSKRWNTHCGTTNFLMTRGFLPACLLWVTCCTSNPNLQKLHAALKQDNHKQKKHQEVSPAQGGRKNTFPPLPVTPHSLQYLGQEKEYGSIGAWIERDKSLEKQKLVEKCWV